MSNKDEQTEEPKRRDGRPYKLTDDKTRQLIFKVLRAGGSRADAAAKANVDVKTIKNAAKRDPSFSQGLADAEIDGKLSLLVTIRESAKAGDWRAAAWMLERKYWREYSKRNVDQVTPDQVAKVSEQIVEALMRLVPAEYHPPLEARMEQILLRLERAS